MCFVGLDVGSLSCDAVLKVNTPETPDIIGALGAAIIAFERIKNEVTF